MRTENVCLGLLEPDLYGNSHWVFFDQYHILMVGLVMQAPTRGGVVAWAMRR